MQVIILVIYMTAQSSLLNKAMPSFVLKQKLKQRPIEMLASLQRTEIDQFNRIWNCSRKWGSVCMNRMNFVSELRLTINIPIRHWEIPQYIELDSLLILIQKINGVSTHYMISPTASVIVTKEFHIHYARCNLKLEDNYIIGSLKN